MRSITPPGPFPAKGILSRGKPAGGPPCLKEEKFSWLLTVFARFTGEATPWTAFRVAKQREADSI